jgi:hypothetical protein
MVGLGLVYGAPRPHHTTSEQKSEGPQPTQPPTMEASSCSLWGCSMCTYSENKWSAKECEVCGAAVSAKRPASPVPASVAMASKPNKLSRKTAVAKKKPPPQYPPPSTHPSGVVIDVVGTSRGNRGRSWEEHPDGCGAAVLAVDVVPPAPNSQVKSLRWISTSKVM